jgi:hypothetical protein
LETRAVGGARRGRGAYRGAYRGRAKPTPAAKGQTIDLGDVVIETTLQEITMVGRTPVPTPESDEALVRRLLVDGPAYLRAAATEAS